MGIFDSLKDTGNLVKSTFVVIGKNPAILRPTFSQIYFGGAFFLSFIISLVLAGLLANSIGSIFMFLAILIILVFIVSFPFVKMYYRAAQCWIVYNTFTGTQSTYQDGLSRAKQNKGDIFLLGLFDIILTALAKRLKQGSGKGGLLGFLINILMWFVGKIVEEVWDLVNHYLLPACIIQDKSVIETIPELGNLRKNVPGALAGVFGFDFAGDLIKRYVIGTLVFIAVIFGIITFLIFQTWVPLIILILIIIFINSILMVFVSMVKTIYFTLMYISVTMPNKIAPQYKAEVTNYLLKKTSDETKPAQTKAVEIKLPEVKKTTEKKK